MITQQGICPAEFTEDLKRSAVEKQTIEATVARQQEETKKGTAELTLLEADFDKTTKRSTQCSQRSGDQETYDDTNMPVLTDQIEKKRKEIEESEQPSRNKEGDTNDAMRERQRFTSRLAEPVKTANNMTTQWANRSRHNGIKRTDCDLQITDSRAGRTPEGIFRRTQRIAGPQVRDLAANPEIRIKDQ